MPENEPKCPKCGSENFDGLGLQGLQICFAAKSAKSPPKGFKRGRGEKIA